MLFSENILYGILYRDGKSVYGLGQSYYPSFRPDKHPVPPEMDRIGEMRKDLNDLAESGFNLVRLAAVGSVRRESNGSIEVDFPFPDAICAEAEKYGLAAMVRLNGYSFHLPDSDGIVMQNEKGEDIPDYWGWFVRHCLNHPAVIKDECEGTAACAIHFSRFPSVVGWQIYNEPAYPAKGLYDYHPYSVAAWRKWLAETHWKTPGEAEKATPPVNAPGEDSADRISWRLFHLIRLNDYLNMLSDCAKKVVPGRETLTCCMPCPLQPGNSLRGEDYFRLAEKMDMLGITLYYGASGAVYFYTSEILALAESAAAVYGKHAWIVEYNAGTQQPADSWDREAYAAAGAGIKGIVYYQWRGDYPYPGTPEAERFGMIYSDRRKTPKFERAVAMTRLLDRRGTILAEAEKVRSGVAVLFSEYANAYCGAVENTNPDNRTGNVSMIHVERNVALMFQCYRDFSKAGVAVDFVRAKDLAENRLNVKLLLIPLKSALSPEELELIDVFRANGGFVAGHDPYSVDLGYFMDAAAESDPDDPGYLAGIRVNSLEAEHILIRAGIEPLFSTDASHLDAKILVGDGYTIVSLVNYDSFERTIPEGRHLDVAVKKKIVSVEFETSSVHLFPEYRLDGTVCRIVLPEIRTGGFLVIKYS